MRRLQVKLFVLGGVSGDFEFEILSENFVSEHVLN